ncbi:MAG: oligosaccharide repeat unit polymerase [Candidatus Aminicenantes bacterium]|nr:MAG: oligosaccharide repeat unit polymerase [Candidatus Aminicenantes bacterium]
MDGAFNVYKPEIRRTTLIVEFLLFCGVLLLLLLGYKGVFKLPVQALTGVIFAAVGASLFFQHISGLPVLWNKRNFILLGVLFWVLLDPLQMREGIDEFSYDVIVETLLYVVIFMAMVSLGYFFPPYRKLERAFSRIQEPRSGRQVFSLIIIVYLIGIAPMLYYSRGSLYLFGEIFFAGYNWNADLGWRRGALGTGRDYFITILQYFLFGGAFLAVWALRRISLWQWQRIILFLIVVSVLATIYFCGSRRIFAFVVIGLLLYLYTAISHKKRRRWRFVFLLAPIMLLLLMQIQMQFRAIGFYDIDISDIRAIEKRLNYLHRDNNFYWLATAVNVMPEQYSFTREWPFLNFFIHPVPRFIWPGKPVSEGFPFISWREEGSSLSISVIGEFYIAQGLLGVIIAGLVFGWAARNWDQLARIALKGNIYSLIYFMGGVLFFILGVRGISDIYTQWYSVWFVIGLLYFLGRKEKRLMAAGSNSRQ